MPLPKEHRLQKTADFRGVAKNSKSAKEGRLLLRARRSGEPFARFGIVVGKNVAKNATTRNRVRRLLAEAIAAHPNLLKLPYDMVFIALPGLQLQSFKDAQAHIAKAVQKASL